MEIKAINICLRSVILCLAIVATLFMFGCKGKGESPETSQEVTAQTAETSYPETDKAVPEDSSALKTAGMEAIQKYQYTWSEGDEMPAMVIIVDDFGQISGDLLSDFAKLPKEVAFAILPDLPNTKAAARLSDQTGHEALIHIPMQAVGNENPGKRYIKPGMELAEISELLGDFYAQIPNAIAANNHMGSGTTSDFDTMSIVLGELREMGIFFVDSATTNKSAVPAAAKKLRVQTGKRDIFLDVPDNSDATLISKIQSLAKFKGRMEPIVVISHCHNRTKLLSLQKFITQVTNMGIKLIPPSQILKTNT